MNDFLKLVLTFYKHKKKKIKIIVFIVENHTLKEELLLLRSY